MPRKSLIHYIAPSALSITPNCNGTSEDLAVSVSEGAKIRVYSPKAHIDFVDGTFQEWTLRGRNRRLADSARPYTIYARIAKTYDPDNPSVTYDTVERDAYLVFAPRQQKDGTWIDKYPYVTRDGFAGVRELEESVEDSGDSGDSSGSSGSSVSQGLQPGTGRTRGGLSWIAPGNPGEYWYVRLGEVSLPEGGKRTVALDTGLLGTEQFNELWNLDPDQMQFIRISCTVGDGTDFREAGQSPYVYWEQYLRLTAELSDGWQEEYGDAFDHWEIVRDSGDVIADTAWLEEEHVVAFGTDGFIEMAHQRPGWKDPLDPEAKPHDDFNGAVSATYWVSAWGIDTSGSLFRIALESVSVMAETAERYELSLSHVIVSYNPQTRTYNPEGGVQVRVKAVDQRGDFIRVTRSRYLAAGLGMGYRKKETDEWTPLPLEDVGDEEEEERHADDIAVAVIAVAEVFADQQGIELHLTSGEDATMEELASANIAFVRDGEDSRDREWVFQRQKKPTVFGDDPDGANPKPSVIAMGEVSPGGTAHGTETDKSKDDWVPNGWTDDSLGTDEEWPYEYGSYRDWDSVHGTWGEFYPPRIWSHFGQDAVTYDLLPSVSIISATQDGTVTTADIAVVAFRNDATGQSANLLPETEMPSSGDYYYAEYRVDGGSWAACSVFTREDETKGYGAPKAAVRSVTESLVFRLKHTSDPATALKESMTLTVFRSMDPETAGDMFLSKTHEDVAQEVIAFLKGLKIGGLDSIYGFDAGANGHLVSLLLDDFLKAANIIFTNVLKSEGASKGFLDGKGIYMDALEGLIQTDGLEVRGFMRIMELIINRLQLMESDYSFTEGANVEHIDYLQDGKLKLWIHKEHDNDYQPFYYGDILEARVNNLLPRGAAVPDGHTSTKHGSYYTVWMTVYDTDFNDNTITVSLYRSLKPDGSARVPGAHNFTFYGTSIREHADNPAAAVLSETSVTAPVALDNNVVIGVPDKDGEGDARTIGKNGFDTNIALTRRGNTADGWNPQTGQVDERIRQSQLGRQQSWVLSTTDQRLTYYWHVDEPFYRSDNVAMCLGILPTMLDDDGILPSTRDKSMPSLYVNTIFYEYSHHIHYPSRVVKEDRGEWVSPDASAVPPQPSATYDGEAGTYTPSTGDGSLDMLAEDVAAGRIPANRAKAGTIAFLKSLAGTYATGQDVYEPYHCESITAVEWLSQRLSSSWNHLTDRQLYLKMVVEWHLDLETSRVWRNGKLWECLAECTAQEPALGCTDWLMISGDTSWRIEFQSSNGNSFYQGHVQTTVTARLLWGGIDVTEEVGAAAFTWTRSSESGKTAADTAWDEKTVAGRQIHKGTNVLPLTDDDMPTAWSRNNKAVFTCSVTYGDEVVAENEVIA